MLAAIVLGLGGTQVRAETSVDEAQDALWSCVKDFARSLAHHSPLDTEAIADQSLQSCNASLDSFRRVLMESSEGQSPDQVEARMNLSRDLAGYVARSTVDSVRSPQDVREINEDDVGIWMSPGLTEEETAETRRPRLILPASGYPLPKL